MSESGFRPYSEETQITELHLKVIYSRHRVASPFSEPAWAKAAAAPDWRPDLVEAAGPGVDRHLVARQVTIATAWAAFWRRPVHQSAMGVPWQRGAVISCFDHSSTGRGEARSLSWRTKRVSR